jgi:hypothetical protein
MGSNAERSTHNNLTSIGNTLWALDTLPIPAMSAECERVSSAKRLLSLKRNALADNTVDACECLKAWWDQGLIRGLGKSDAESFNSLTTARWPEHLNSGPIGKAWQRRKEDT